MSGERLIYLPLGGAGEIGMNAYVYGYGPEGAERYILVDLGVTFPDMDGSPGVDLILPDMAWLMDRADRLDGVFVTHAHEDHVGGVGILAARLNAPIYARSFTAAIARRKLEERGHDPDMVQICDAWPSTTDVGPFKVGFLPVSHSIPQASGMVIDTPAGRLVHTGDFYCFFTVLQFKCRWWPSKVVHPVNLPLNIEALPHQVCLLPFLAALAAL